MSTLKSEVESLVQLASQQVIPEGWQRKHLHLISLAVGGGGVRKVPGRPAARSHGRAPLGTRRGDGRTAAEPAWRGRLSEVGRQTERRVYPLLPGPFQVLQLEH